MVIQYWAPTAYSGPMASLESTEPHYPVLRECHRLEWMVLMAHHFQEQPVCPRLDFHLR